MPDYLLQNFAISILGLAATLALLLFFREYNLRRKLQEEGDKFLENIKEKGLETLHSSIKKSQDVLGQAELEGIKVLASAKFETSKLEQAYARKLEDLIKESGVEITSAQAQLLQFMAELQKRSQEFEDASQKTTQERINQLFDRLEQRLSDFLVETSQKTTQSIELEVKSTRNLIESYKEQQLKLIDENIIAMMEKTLSLVLNKKLSLKDQLDLIYEALEKAKIEKFIVY